MIKYECDMCGSNNNINIIYDGLRFFSNKKETRQDKILCCLCEECFNKIISPNILYKGEVRRNNND